MKNAKGSIYLLIAAFIWGTAFVAQSLGLNRVGAFTFNAIRNYIGAFTLLPIILIMQMKDKVKDDTKKLWIGGLCCGIALTVASSLQQIGIAEGTEAGKAGFITALYIIFVPLFSLFTKKKPKPTIWLAVFLATVGMYLLCVKEGLTVQKGDIYVFLCAIAFTFHILVIDKFSREVNPVKLSCVQFFVCAVISTFLMLMFEEPNFADIKLAALPILYTGVLSSGVAYTLQAVGQKYSPPTLATLIMSLESVFAVLAGWIVLEQAMSTPEIIGSVLVFAGIIIAQIF